MNNYAKMRRSNVKVRRWLEDNLYKDIHFFPHSRFCKDVHFSEQSFDGIASSDTKLILFQVKSNSMMPKEIKKQYLEIAKKYSLRLIWFNIRDRKKPVVEIFE
jgi:hypothetical protein